MKRPKYKAVVKVTPNGYELDLYKRMFIGWAWEAGMYPTFERLQDIDERLDRWIEMFGDSLMVKDCRKER